MTPDPETVNLSPDGFDKDCFDHSDFDRALAAGSYYRAGEFTKLIGVSIVEQRPSQVVKNAGHAIQFALKAVLLYSGHADKWINLHIGRDLETAMALASSCGMPPPTIEFTALIPELSRYHTLGRNLGQARIFSMMNSRQIFDNVDALIDRTGHFLRLQDIDRTEMYEPNQTYFQVRTDGFIGS